MLRCRGAAREEQRRLGEDVFMLAILRSCDLTACALRVLSRAAMATASPRTSGMVQVRKEHADATRDRSESAQISPKLPKQKVRYIDERWKVQLWCFPLCPSSWTQIIWSFAPSDDQDLRQEVDPANPPATGSCRVPGHCSQVRGTRILRND